MRDEGVRLDVSRESDIALWLMSVGDVGRQNVAPAYSAFPNRQVKYEHHHAPRNQAGLREYRSESANVGVS